jgi:hypothetical protein
MWLEAGVGYSITSSAGTNYVTAWADQSGNGNAMTQGTAANWPTEAAVTFGSNSFQVVNCVASNTNGISGGKDGQFLNVTTPFPAPVSVFYVGRSLASSGLEGRNLVGVNNNWLLGTWESTEASAFFGGWVDQGAQAVDSNWYLWEMETDGVTTAFFRNGQLLASNSNGLQGPNGLQICGQTNEFSSAQVAEIMVYNGTLLPSQRQTVENYLSNKFAITSSSAAWNPGQTVACAPGFTSVNNGRLCVDSTLETATTFYAAQIVCQAKPAAYGAHAHVCRYTEGQDACAAYAAGELTFDFFAGVTSADTCTVTSFPYGTTATSTQSYCSWYSDEIGDDLFLTSNSPGCAYYGGGNSYNVGNNNGSPAGQGQSMPYRCCY